MVSFTPGANLDADGPRIIEFNSRLEILKRRHLASFDIDLQNITDILDGKE